MNNRNFGIIAILTISTLAHGCSPKLTKPREKTTVAPQSLENTLASIDPIEPSNPAVQPTSSPTPQVMSPLAGKSFSAMFEIRRRSRSETRAYSISFSQDGFAENASIFSGSNQEGIFGSKSDESGQYEIMGAVIRLRNSAGRAVEILADDGNFSAINDPTGNFSLRLDERASLVGSQYLGNTLCVSPSNRQSRIGCSVKIQFSAQSVGISGRRDGRTLFEYSLGYEKRANEIRFISNSEPGPQPNHHIFGSYARLEVSPREALVLINGNRLRKVQTHDPSRQ